MIASTISKNGIPIRLTEERWQHIITEHGELAELQAMVLETVAQPRVLWQVVMASCWRSVRYNPANS